MISSPCGFGGEIGISSLGKEVVEDGTFSRCKGEDEKFANASGSGLVYLDTGDDVSPLLGLRLTRKVSLVIDQRDQVEVSAVLFP